MTTRAVPAATIPNLATAGDPTDPGVPICSDCATPRATCDCCRQCGRPKAEGCEPWCLEIEAAVRRFEEDRDES